MFLDLVKALTGKPLAADAWVARLQLPLDQLLARERGEYEAAVKGGPRVAPGGAFDMGMVVRLVRGAGLGGASLPLLPALHRCACMGARAARRAPPPGALNLRRALALAPPAQVDGDDVIADSRTDGGVGGACAKFKAWVRERYFQGAGA